MKTLKFEHYQAELIAQGQKKSTWRLYDDKDLSVDDEIRIVDKVDPNSSDTWQVIGHGKVNEIIEKRLGDVTPDDMKAHEAFASKEEMLAKYKSYYGERVTFDTPVKIIYFDFTPTVGEIPTGAMLLEEAKIYTDGGSRGNPGESACAYAICKMDGTVVEKSGFYIGIATNNQAEYFGFKRGLERARELGIDKVTLFSDSELVVKQMNGLYKVKNQELAPLNHEVKTLADSFEKITFVHVPRELNKTTDTEVNRILDAQERAKRKKH
ncbi:MAG TPA: reverse transcriptase-like protein [Candidatus Saccharimonadales bacterium]|nr:reverse transcriptase-like protein [Candidatus Saccharimonadales bacterium]